MSSLAALPRPSANRVVKRTATARAVRPQRRRKWLVALLAIVVAPGLFALPPVWQATVKTYLTWRASRCGYALTIARMRGGPFSVTQLDGVHLSPRGASPLIKDAGTDLTAARVQFTFAWTLPWQRASEPWLREIRLEGVRGRLDLSPISRPGHSDQRHLTTVVAQSLPANFVLQADDLQLQRGDDRLRVIDLMLTGRANADGVIAAHELRIERPGFDHTLADWHGRTVWKDDRLTLTGLDFGHGLSLASATLDASQIRRQRLDWDCDVLALGGEIRGQGAVDFSNDTLEFAATLHHTALAPLAHLLGIRGAVDGQVEQATFNFRGDPENPAAAQISLSARATGFRWGERRWQSLDTQAVVVNRRVQLHRFDLRQDGNSLSLSGEYPLPPDEAVGLVWSGDGSWWRAAGFSCSVDARLEDLHALADLAGPGVPELAGRMSINGRLSATPGHAEIEGYLNVEGTRLTICGTPLDFLRSTLLFRRGAMEVADVQATHDADYFTAHGVVGLGGEHPDRRGEVRAEIRDMSVYAPVLAAWPNIGGRALTVRNLNAVLRLENGEILFDQWDGDQADRLLAR